MCPFNLEAFLFIMKYTDQVWRDLLKERGITFRAALRTDNMQPETDPEVMRIEALMEKTHSARTALWREALDSLPHLTPHDDIKRMHEIGIEAWRQERQELFALWRTISDSLNTH